MHFVIINKHLNNSATIKISLSKSENTIFVRYFYRIKILKWIHSFRLPS